MFYASSFPIPTTNILLFGVLVLLVVFVVFVVFVIHAIFQICIQSPICARLNPYAINNNL